ncbi:hypothetical protein [Spiroplasma turonicum]|uniref:Uncharacterized protein n=1 Tax=Spiroplasma turonicum TaxID=216946 RepID=A0A0K1P4X0_9MOLU|nr:hypothetical protein [Spiroplasma turonicum]AKU79345.1 hypothetical protein STURON_0099 [Spiroplasma turonicum]ALX70366.1 hypothetical protein STURO_v1c00970 [Spiroplasma turonicum]
MDSNLLKKSNNHNSYKNFNNLYAINLKITLKSPGILTMGIIMAALLFILFIIEFSVEYSIEASYSTYRDIVYIFISFTVLLYTLVSSFYLYKKQNKTGIQAIELRAGYTVLKSFLIRQFVQLTSFFIYVLPVIILSFSFIYIFNMTISFYFGTVFSQIFFILFLGLFSTIIINSFVLLFKTAMSACLSTIFIIILSLVPFIYNLSKIMNSNKEIQSYISTNLKLKSGYDFYDNFKNNQEINYIFSDESKNQNSSTLENIYENYNSALFNLDNDSVYNRLKSDDIKLWRFNERNSNDPILVYPIKKGAVLFNYMLKNENQENDNKSWTLLNNTNIGKLLLNINKQLLDINFESLPKKFSNIKPNIYNSYIYSTNNKLNVTLENLLTAFNNYLPQYNDLAEFINNFYIRNYEYLTNNNSENIKLLDTISTSGENGNNSWLKWDEGIKNISGSPDKDIVEQNNNYKKKYEKFPELLIFNSILLGLWKNSMIFNVYDKLDVSYSLDSYENFKQKFSGASTNIILHFPMMFSGVFMNPVQDDSLSTIATLSVSKPSAYISNIFSFEKYAPENKINTNNPALEPIYKNSNLEYSSYFIKGLAFFIYLLLVSPIVYFNYILFKRKAKI